jgi:predicted AlkP superfamily pyrophosphatase or phosphodiesterase
VLLSVPGLDAAALARSREGRPALATLSALARAGAVAPRVQGVAPASTYPAHATLSTGALPAEHGVVADRRLGDRGVRTARYAHASHLRAATLWQRIGEAGRPVAALDWPSTRGATIARLLPDADAPQGNWLAALGDAATPSLRDFVAQHGGAEPAAARPGPARDDILLALACELLSGDAPPDLLLVRLGGTGPALAEFGPGSRQANEAFADLDRGLHGLLGCLSSADRLEATALAITGDHGTAAVHTAIAANAVLAQAGLQTLERGGVASWQALARANGGTAFVYARDDRSAISARLALSDAAEATRAFRVVSADEMIQSGADPEAWFGLEAEPGYAFSDAARAHLLTPSALRGVGGYLPDRPEMDAALVLWGSGVRTGLSIPRMGQVDLAPTLALLLGVELEPGAGRALVGVLSTTSPAVAAPGARE